MKLVNGISNELLGAVMGKKPEELDAVDIRNNKTVILHRGQLIAVVQEVPEGKPQKPSERKKAVEA